MTDKDKKQIAITGVLIVVLILFVSNAFKGVKKKPRPKKKPAPSSAPAQRAGKKAPAPAAKGTHQAAVVPAKGGGELYLKLEEESAALTVTRDPFAFASVGGQGIFLTGIIWDEQNPRIVINNTIFAIGDKVSDDTIVVDIKPDFVILNDGETDFELRLEE